MLNKIVECVPNYSVGNNPEVLKAITAPFENNAALRLLSVEPDDDYNRTVVTVIGDPQAMVQAMVVSYQAAMSLIDMTKHHGEHKRMGAIDVIPFIPIMNMTIEETITLSEQAAQLINQQTKIPVFLYNLSAKMGNRKSLPDIRNGEFEGMAEKVKQPEWYPDFGSGCHPTAGVVAVGCRPLLVAFNVDLDTTDRSIALAIAKAVRYSSGGYRAIQAGPVVLADKGIVQVTMNVTDYQVTSVYRAFEAVKMEAKRFKVDVIGSEFIGLVSLDCLKDIAAYYLQRLTKHEVNDLTMEAVVQCVSDNLLLHGFGIEKVIEYHV